MGKIYVATEKEVYEDWTIIGVARTQEEAFDLCKKHAKEHDLIQIGIIDMDDGPRILCQEKDDLGTKHIYDVQEFPLSE